MVDFNNEATIGTPAINIVKILILQARANVLEALEVYNKKISQGVSWDQAILKARILTWFIELQAYLERALKPEDYEQFIKKVKDDYLFNETDIEKADLISLIIELNKTMDELRITRIDLRRQYDKTNIEEDNLQNELS